jgi:hypothetical protein
METVRISMLLLLLVAFVISANAKQQEMSGTIRFAEQVQAAGEMTTSEYFRLNHITTLAENGNTISKSDFDWAIKLLKSPPLTNKHNSKSFRHIEIVHRLLIIRNLTNHESKALFAAAIWLSASGDVIDRELGALIALKLRSAQGDLLLLKLSHDPAPAVTSFAKKCLSARSRKLNIAH